MKKFFISIIVIIAAGLGILIFGIDDEDIDESFLEDEDSWLNDGDSWFNDPQSDFNQLIDPGLIGHSGSEDESWTICWYLCGSDLESENGAATDDLEELMEVELPDNINVVIETGGASEWMNYTVDERKLERYLYSSAGLELLQQLPNKNMGGSRTLADFLRFCRKNFPADKTAFIFWDHGGGGISGAVFDENFGYDSLTCEEFRKAFTEVYEPSAADPPIELIGFDACLMSSVDTAAAFQGIARCMVASEEFEPGWGWNYSGFMEELAWDPGMDGARLGQHICDSYMEGCGWFFDWECTMSVIDLTRLQPLLQAYENMGLEALEKALSDPGFFSLFARRAEDSENYGGNTRDMGYANHVDMGDLAEHCLDILPSGSRQVLSALDRCVIYNVSGLYRSEASGLSCFHSYNGDIDELEDYRKLGCCFSFKYFYDYWLLGKLPPEGMEFIYNEIGFDEPQVPQVPELSSGYAGDYPLYLDDEGYVTMELDADTVNMLKGVYYQLACVDEKGENLVILGRDNYMEQDWENGIFRDDFRALWGSIDGHLVCMELYYEGDSYDAFTVPILLNGRECSLRVIFDFEDEKFYILGARQGLEDNGMADRNLTQLRPGDKITVIRYISPLDDENADFTAAEGDSFTVKKDTAFYEAELPDGLYYMCFELVDARNNTAYSELVQIVLEGDDMYIELPE